MVEAMAIASIGWTMYGNPFPRRSVPAWAWTANRMALSNSDVSSGPFIVSPCYA